MLKHVHVRYYHYLVSTYTPCNNHPDSGRLDALAFPAQVKVCGKKEEGDPANADLYK